MRSRLALWLAGKVLTITTASVNLSYTLGEAFGPETLSVRGLDEDSAFGAWSFGMADTGNLLGTIRTLDAEDAPPLNCTLVQVRSKGAVPRGAWLFSLKSGCLDCWGRGRGVVGLGSVTKHTSTNCHWPRSPRARMCDICGSAMRAW